MDTGEVSGIVPPTMMDPLDIPIAVKVDSKGNLYWDGRRSGNVYKFNLKSPGLPQILATTEPALDNLCLSLDETKIYVTNDENRITQVDAKTGAQKILFDSPFVEPFDIAYDSDDKTLFA